MIVDCLIHSLWTDIAIATLICSMKSKVTVQLGKNIKRMRLEKGFTQEKLAELSQIHPVYVSYVEKGVRNITVDRAFRIANALSCDISELFKGLKK